MNIRCFFREVKWKILRARTYFDIAQLSLIFRAKTYLTENKFLTFQRIAYHTIIFKPSKKTDSLNPCDFGHYSRQEQWELNRWELTQGNYS